MKRSELLYKAAEYIGEHGHHKGTYEGPDGSVCALGAIRAVHNVDGLGGYDTFGTPNELAASALVEYLGSGVDTWNDAPETSAEDVILIMKTVAAQLEENE